MIAKHIKKLAITVSLAVLIGICIMLFSAPKTGSLRIQAVDAYTLEPIQDAYIIAARCGISAYTDELGFAYLNDVPFKPNALFSRVAECEWGEVELVALADGYMPYALLHALIYPNSLRLGPTLYLFPLGEEGVQVTTMTESPSEEDMLKLIEYSMYRQE